MRRIIKFIFKHTLKMCKHRVNFDVMKSPYVLRRFSDDALDKKPWVQPNNSNNKTHEQITSEESSIRGHIDINVTKDQGAKDKVTNTAFSLPTIPDNCCGSGCTNCVWIEFANEINTLPLKAKESLKEDISDHIEQITDPTIRAFVKISLTLDN